MLTTPPPASTVRVLEDDLQLILQDSKTKKPFTVQDIIACLEGRDYLILAIILSLPFCQPIQIPGLSIPFGILIFFIGLRLAFDGHFWWPQWILKKEMSPTLVDKIVQKTFWFVNKTQNIFKQRLLWLCNPSLMFLHGVVIALMGLFFAIPIPIPFINIFGAWAVVFLSMGLIRLDGLFVGLGYLLAVIYMGVSIFIIMESLRFIDQY